MAQLPPKIPNTTPNWPDLSKHHHPHHHHHRMSSLGSISTPDNNNNGNDTTTTATAAKSQSPYWVDEFLDFSSAKRNAHRRSASDSATYLEKAPMPVGGRDNNVSKNEFQRFDDEHFMSLFADQVSREVSNPSTPSDHNDQTQRPQQGNETEEVESTKEQRPTQGSTTTSHDRIVDPKRVKRILANRQSAQRSRVKKLQYISELERSITSLQAEVSVLSPRVAFLDHQRLLLNVDNSALKQRIAALQQDKIFKEAHQEALKREIERLMQVHQQQQNNLKSMENQKDPPLNPNAAPNETELMLNV